MSRRSLVIAALTAALLALAAPAALACPRASGPDVEGEVMCLVCGTALNVAEGPAADDERAFIRREVAQCKTKQQIKRDLVAQLGPGVLASPRGSGFDLAAWIVPGLAVLIALGALAVTVPRWRRRSRPGDPPDGAAALSPAEARRLDDDLARYDL